MSRTKRISKTKGQSAYDPARIFVAALIAAASLSACVSEPAYRPQGPNGGAGYTDEQLSPNRFRVSFTGESSLARDAVEDGLLRRASEIALMAGFTHFTFDTRDTERQTTYYRSDFGPRTGFGFGYGPRFVGPRPWYWSSFAFGDPYFDRTRITPVSRYTAYAEIVTLTAEQAAGNPDAIDARVMLDRLTPPPADAPLPPPPPPG